MADSIFPSANNVGSGKTITEPTLASLLGAVFGATKGQVVSGLAASAGAGLSASVAAGVALVDGRLITEDAGALAMTANATEYLYLDVALDVSGNATAAALAKSATVPAATATSKPVLLAKIVSGAAAITSVRDYRTLVADPTNPLQFQASGYSATIPIGDPSGYVGDYRFRKHPQYRFAFVTFWENSSGSCNHRVWVQPHTKGIQTSSTVALANGTLVTTRIDLSAIADFEPTHVQAQLLNVVSDSVTCRTWIHFSNDPEALAYTHDVVANY